MIRKGVEIRRLVFVRRRLLIAAAFTSAVTIVAWWFIAEIAWALRGLMVGVDSPRGIEDTRFALALFAVVGANVVALAIYVASRMGWGWWVLLGVQAADVMFGGYAALTRNLGWLLIMGLAVPTAALLYLGRRAPA